MNHFLPKSPCKTGPRKPVKQHKQECIISLASQAIFLVGRGGGGFRTDEVRVCIAMPCIAMPCHAMPCHAMPKLVLWCCSRAYGSCEGSSAVCADLSWISPEGSDLQGTSESIPVHQVLDNAESVIVACRQYSRMYALRRQRVPAPPPWQLSERSHSVALMRVHITQNSYDAIGLGKQVVLMASLMATSQDRTFDAQDCVEIVDGGGRKLHLRTFASQQNIARSCL